jgi:hypothetical protein
LPGYVKKAPYAGVDELSIESFIALCHVAPLLHKKIPTNLALIIGGVSKVLFRAWYRTFLGGRKAAGMEIQDKKSKFLPEG